jgi:hypothetical protein
MLYQNDGLYGHFMNCLMEGGIFHPFLVPDGGSPEERGIGPHRYTIWGKEQEDEEEEEKV